MKWVTARSHILVGNHLYVHTCEYTCRTRLPQASQWEKIPVSFPTPAAWCPPWCQLLHACCSQIIREFPYSVLFPQGDQHYLTKILKWPVLLSASLCSVLRKWLLLWPQPDSRVSLTLSVNTHLPGTAPAWAADSPATILRVSFLRCWPVEGWFLRLSNMSISHEDLWNTANLYF